MSYETYKIIHLSGMLLLFMGLGGLYMHTFLNKGKKSDGYKLSMMFHGLSLAMILLGGFGMLAKLGIHWPWPSWVIAKFSLWVIFGAASVIIKKTAHSSKLAWWLLPTLGACAVILAIMKPF